MKYFKPFLCIALMLMAFLSASAAGEKKEGIDLQGILFGHIQDSYEWHVTDIGETPVVIHLPVIVKSSTGWHVFCSSAFEHHADAQGNRPGPYGLYISGSEANKDKIVENIGGQEVRPLDISMTKTVVGEFAGFCEFEGEAL